MNASDVCESDARGTHRGKAGGIRAQDESRLTAANSIFPVK